MHASNGTRACRRQRQGLANAIWALTSKTIWQRLRTHGGYYSRRAFSSRATVGILQVLDHLRDANTLMGMKSLALSFARRIYGDLRAAAALGGYYFNFTNLEPHLEMSDDILFENYSCDAEG